MGLLVGRETKDGFEPSWLHRWLRPAVSGNALNGVGETADRPATALYHRLDRVGPWLLVNLSFVIRQMWDIGPRGQVWPLLRDFRNKLAEFFRRKDVAASQVTESPESWTRQVRAHARASRLCADLGVTRMHAGLYFEGGVPDEGTGPRYAIVLLQPMAYEPLSATLEAEDWTRRPFWRRKWVRSVREVMRTYADVHQGAVSLAAWIRARGHRAEAVGGAPGSDINILWAAIEAGLGELGKHGSIIHREHGSAVRFAVVLTDLPLMPDVPADFGADDFCASCRICETACPPKAISSTKQLVRGVEKWYVDFDACVPYFNETNGCGVCITACPWSRPGIAENLARKLERRREKRGRGVD
ncbi:MAG: 4Fe-4S dicluster domain-containing protein [Myxococcota bacterium]